MTWALAMALQKALCGRGARASTSSLVNLDVAIQRIRAVHERYPEMPIGLHLNITLARPVHPPD